MRKIAAIISQIEESCQAHIWDGVVGAAERQGVKLVTFVAYSLDSDDEIRSHYKMFQDFITSDHFDGVILFTGAMSEYTPWPVVKRYSQSITLPLVTIAGSTGCGSNVLINNKSGIIEMVNHLVDVHNRRNIAFIGGPSSNEEATERLAAYREGLGNCGIEYDSAIVCEGDFSEESGEEGIAEFLSNNSFFDAVICADDYTAIGAMKELKKNNIRVPEDVSIVGFDDIPEAGMLTPALTTIQQPFALQGETALNTLLNMIEVNQNSDPETVLLNTHGVYRSSCGCTSEEVRMFRESWHAERSLLGRDSFRDFIYEFDPLVAYHIIELKLHSSVAIEYRKFAHAAIERIWNAFFDEIENHTTSRGLLVVLMETLDENSQYTDSLILWQGLLSNLTPFAYHCDDKQSQLLAGAILHEARIALDSREKREAQMLSYEKMSIDEAIRESCTKIITSGSQKELMTVVAGELSELGFDHARMVIFNHYSPISLEEWNLPSKVYVTAYVSDGEEFVVEDEAEQLFDSSELMPFPDYGEFDGGKNTVFMPLYMNGDYFGYYLFEVIPEAQKEVYSELQIHTSSALKSCFMLDSLRALSMNDELTGLSNRRGFMLLANQLYAKAVNSGTDLLVFYFDMDNLKMINDTFSHEDGDAAIKATASLLKRTFRNHDIIGRLGGDEFVAIVEEAVPALDRTLEKRLRDLVLTYNEHSGHPYEVDMSLGVVSLSTASHETVEEAMKRADSAMFENKKLRKKGRDFQK